MANSKSGYYSSMSLASPLCRRTMSTHAEHCSLFLFEFSYFSGDERETVNTEAFDFEPKIPLKASMYFTTLKTFAMGLLNGAADLFPPPPQLILFLSLSQFKTLKISPIHSIDPKPKPAPHPSFTVFHAFLTDLSLKRYPIWRPKATESYSILISCTSNYHYHYHSRSYSDPPEMKIQVIIIRLSSQSFQTQNPRTSYVLLHLGRNAWNDSLCPLGFSDDFCPLVLYCR